MNKKLIMLDCLTLGVGVLLFILISVFKNMLSGSAFDYILITLLIIYGIFFTLMCYKEEVNSIGNAFVPIVLLIILFIIYNLPFWRFYGDKGVQNSIIIGIFGLLVSRIFFSLSSFFSIRYQTTRNKTELILDIYTNRIAILTLIVVTLFIVFNTIQPQIDVSRLLSI